MYSHCLNRLLLLQPYKYIHFTKAERMAKLRPWQIFAHFYGPYSFFYQEFNYIQQLQYICTFDNETEDRLTIGAYDTVNAFHTNSSLFYQGKCPLYYLYSSCSHVKIVSCM